MHYYLHSIYYELSSQVNGKTRVLFALKSGSRCRLAIACLVEVTALDYHSRTR